MSGWAIPRYEGGEEIGAGCRVKLEDGTLVRVEALALTAAGTFVSDVAIGEGERRWRRVGDVVRSPDEDSLEEVAADKALSISEYVRKRALDVEGMGAEERRSAVLDDLLSRQEACLRRILSTSVGISE